MMTEKESCAYDYTREYLGVAGNLAISQKFFENSGSLMTNPRIAGGQVVIVLDDDEAVRESLTALLETDGHRVVPCASGREFLAQADRDAIACLVTDVHMPDASGLDILESLRARDDGLPVIVITGHADVPMAVRAMRAGAFDFVEKPIDGESLLRAVQSAIAARRKARPNAREADALRARFASLTPREQEVLQELIIGRPNKAIAAELGISPRTVEIHRARVMEKLQAESLSHLVRMAIALDEGKR